MIRLLLIAFAYAAAVFIAESTVGNARFPLCLWHFDRIPAWQWSLPVHGAGLVWIIAWTYALRRRPAVIPMIVSWVFFAAAELFNRYLFRFFDYGRVPFGVNVSLVAVLVLYAVLCVIVVYALRMWVFGPRSIRT
jgi:hypothetical protein